MGKEQRRHERSPIECAASYGGIQEDSDIYKEAIVTNMSKGGFAFQSKENLKIGQKITLSVELEDNKEVQLDVQVAWSKENFDTDDFTIGVRILKMEGKNYERFIQFYSTEISET